MADKLGEKQIVETEGAKRELKSWKDVKPKEVTVLDAQTGVETTHKVGTSGKLVDASGASLNLDLADFSEIDKTMPAPGVVTDDLMGAMDPVRDRSEYIEYDFYWCQNPFCKKGSHSDTPVEPKLHRRIFAEGRADARRETCECTCVLMFPQPPDEEHKEAWKAPKLKAYQNPKIEAPQYQHGEMRLYHFKALRPALA